MLKGELGQPAGGWPRALQKKALKGEQPYTAVPGSLLPPSDIDTERKAIEDKLERRVSDFELASYLMYPKVFTDYVRAAETYGPVSVLPTPAYFYGIAAGEELQPEIEKGKSLVILQQAKSEPDEQGMVKVFFELNGQPRLIKVPDRKRAATSAVRRKADAGNVAHLGAPMPGVISTVFVSAGQEVKAGDVLLSIEAMKMETALHADKDGTIAEVLVRAGDQIDAKDLLMVVGPEAVREMTA
jgi:pyruvate carboxylase